MWNLPDLRPIIALAVIGAISIAGGVIWLLWFVLNHVRIVW